MVTAEMNVVPQIDGTNPTTTPDAAAMAITGNNAVDLANIAKEMGVTLDAKGNVTKANAAQPAVVTPSPVPTQPQAATPVVTSEVPAKFQNADGTVNEEKLVKSTKSVEEMLAYYRSKEREAQQVQNRVNNPPATPTAPAHQANQPAQLTQLEISMANDLLAESAAYGAPISQGQAIAQARVMARGLEAKHAAELSITDDIRRELGENRMTLELKALMDADDTLLTPQVADRILEIRKENPRMQSYREAYIHHLGEQEIAKRTGQVKTPTPTGQVAKAPPTPIGPVSRVQSTVNLANPTSLSNEQLEAEIRKAYPRYRGINK